MKAPINSQPVQATSTAAARPINPDRKVSSELCSEWVKMAMPKPSRGAQNPDQHVFAHARRGQPDADKGGKEGVLPAKDEKAQEEQEQQPAHAVFVIGGIIVQHIFCGGKAKRRHPGVDNAIQEQNQPHGGRTGTTSTIARPPKISSVTGRRNRRREDFFNRRRTGQGQHTFTQHNLRDERADHGHHRAPYKHTAQQQLGFFLVAVQPVEDPGQKKTWAQNPEPPT